MWKFKELLTHPEPRDFTTCWFFKNLNVTVCFLLYRCVMAMFLVITLLYMIFDDIINKVEDRWKMYAFVTVWTYILEAFTLTMGFVIAIIARVRQGKNSKQVTSDDEKSINALPVSHKIFWALYVLAVTFAFCVTIGYWVFVFKGNLKFWSVVTHAANSIIMVIDFAVTAHPIKFTHIILVELYLITYVVFSIIYELSGGRGLGGNPTPYAFLRWKTETWKAVVAVVVAHVSVFAVFFILYSLSILKVYLRNKYIKQ